MGARRYTPVMKNDTRWTEIKSFLARARDELRRELDVEKAKRIKDALHQLTEWAKEALPQKLRRGEPPRAQGRVPAPPVSPQEPDERPAATAKRRTPRSKPKVQSKPKAKQKVAPSPKRRKKKGSKS